MTMERVLVVHGPNLNLLGEREPDIYGSETLDSLNQRIIEFADKLGLQLLFFQSNHEGALIDFLHENRNKAGGVIINPGAFTHYSYALRDALEAVQLPTIEVHLSDIQNREDFRKISVIKDVCLKQISGLGPDSYLRALEYLKGTDIHERVKLLKSKDLDRDDLLTKTVHLLSEGCPKYTWVGIYLVEGDDLILNNYIGLPTPHTRIPIGQGICGAAVQQKKTIIVADVGSDPRYLACSLETLSEIVVPIQRDGRVFGEIDIDSDQADAFHSGDQEVLELIAATLASGFR